MAEAAERHRGVPEVCLVSERDLQNANVADHRSGDCSDEEEYGGDEDESHAYPV